MVFTLIDNDICYYSGQMLWLSPQKKKEKENVVVVESTDQAKPWLIY